MLSNLLTTLTKPRRSLLGHPQPLVSNTEDLHTKALLFPDSASLRAEAAHDSLSPSFPSVHSLTDGFTNDCSHGDLDLNSPRDVRVLIAQNDFGGLGPILLFDSKLVDGTEAPKIVKHARGGSRSEAIGHHTRTASGPSRQYGRQPAVESIPESTGKETPAISGGGSFAQRSRARRASMSAAQVHDEHTPVRSKESDESAKLAMEVMFENVPTTYKGISNKIHIVPLESKPYDSSIAGTHFVQPSCKSSGVRRPSSLSSSYTPTDPPAPQSPAKQDSAIDDTPQVENRRRTVFITRTFSVNWTEEDAIPPPLGPHGPQDAKKEKQPIRQTKAKPPMYAITLVLHLPISTNEMTPPPSRGHPSMRRKGSGSQTGQTSLSSSVDSERRGGWTMVDAHTGLESSALSFTSDVDDKVELIGQHWDIIVRTLCSVQTLAAEKILQQLRPLPFKGRPLKLLHLSLAQDPDLKTATLAACSRVVRGIMIPRVRTGQGRWAIWREEARWMERWSGGHERNQFFFNLITAYLGTHTEWLNIIGPVLYRKRHRELQRLAGTEDLAVPSRTVIVSTDKMVARRLIFLLAAFLPANHHHRGDASPLRPSTSASFRYSDSPPAHLVPSRSQSLRRTIKRGKRSTSRQGPSSTRTPQPISGTETPDDGTETETIRPIDDGYQSRNSIDARCIMNTGIPSVETDSVNRKSSATISASAAPGSAPAVHLVRRYTPSDYRATARPTSRDSLASDTLLNTLQRSNTGSDSTESHSASRWGSLKSLWSSTSRRESSTVYSDIIHNNDEGLGIMGIRHSNHLHGKLQQMVDEAELERDRQLQSGMNSPGGIPTTPELMSPEFKAPPSPELSRSQPIDVPLKVSVNQRDGVVDVEIALPGWASSVASPPSQGFHGGSSVGSQSQPSLVSYASRDIEHPLNVAGVLGTVHTDFELQAVPPYLDLLKDVKAAMRAEPNPITLRTFPDGKPVEEWVDVCTTLVTYTADFTIKRLLLRRYVRFLPPPPLPAVTPGIQFPPPKSRWGDPYTAAQLTASPTQITLEERFEESKITDVDPALVSTIERVLAQSTDSSKSPSTTSSRSSSLRGRKGSIVINGMEERVEQEIPHQECKKMVLGALEQIATTIARERMDTKKYGLARLRSLDDNLDSTLREGIKKWFDEVEKINKATELVRLEEMRKAKAKEREKRERKREKLAAAEKEKEKEKEKQREAEESDGDSSTIHPPSDSASIITVIPATPREISTLSPRQEMAKVNEGTSLPSIDEVTIPSIDEVAPTPPLPPQPQPQPISI
ncbi:hypothetical protein EJ08DRAFT_307568 [Tothia fuscella]|uniref:Folliculin-interacting protein N-terminal domain-containing protein n=1 Tax=Tothia fuscella TaxID=1048955 RepID=A0A9P4NNT7_9PEZI|nr:hypothetical protein EJ08DRAFT_307568 [Tothia fuscella]